MTTKPVLGAPPPVEISNVIPSPILGLSAIAMNSIEKVVAWAGPPSSSNVTSSSALQDIVTVSNDGAWREEIEIELRDVKNESFKGTITMQVAKYDIFRDCHGFKDFKD